MSKMTVPTMDVVRFNENDIIVASGGNPTPPPPGPVEYLRLDNFNNGTVGDGLINNKYNIKDYVDLLGIIHEHGLIAHFKYADNAIVSAEDILANEENFVLMDGDYEGSTMSDGSPLWTWVRQ